MRSFPSRRRTTPTSRRRSRDDERIRREVPRTTVSGWTWVPQSGEQVADLLEGGEVGGSARLLRRKYLSLAAVYGLTIRKSTTAAMIGTRSRR